MKARRRLVANSYRVDNRLNDHGSPLSYITPREVICHKNVVILLAEHPGRPSPALKDSGLAGRESSS